MFDLNYFIGKNYFYEHGSQNYIYLNQFLSLLRYLLVLLKKVLDGNLKGCQKGKPQLLLH